MSPDLTTECSQRFFRRNPVVGAIELPLHRRERVTRLEPDAPKAETLVRGAGATKNGRTRGNESGVRDGRLGGLIEVVTLSIGVSEEPYWSLASVLQDRSGCGCFRLQLRRRES